MTALKLPPPVSVCTTTSRPAARKFASTLIERSSIAQAPLDAQERTASPSELAHVVPQAAAPALVTQSVSAARAAQVAPGAEGGRAPSTPSNAAQPPHGGGPTQRPESALFRHEALRAYQLGGRLSAPLAVVPLSTRIVLVSLGAALIAALGVACFGHIDLTARGRGVVRNSEGVQPLLFETDGVVRELLVRDGDVVAAGAVLARLDSTRLSAALHEADQQLTAVRQRTLQDAATAQARYRRDRALLERRARLTRERIESQERSVRALDGERARYVALANDGLVPERNVRDSEALWHQERRGLLALEDELARVEQQAADLEQTFRSGVTRREHELRDASSRRETAALLLGQTQLSATRAGRIESLSVSEGDVIQVGRVIARLVPLVAGRWLTAYVPERDRAFVRAGAPVRLELDQLPVGEFGSVAGRVQRVSSELASQAEMERALGAATPEGVHFAITIELLEDPTTRALLRRLSSGSLLTVRLPVRRRRIIGLLFDPVRRWLD